MLGHYQFFTAMRMKGPGSAFEEVTRSIYEEGGGTPAPAPMPQPCAPTVVPSPIPAPKGIGLDFGFDVFAHPGLWFLFGSLFVILVVFLIEYLGRKMRKED
jgi:hypothetical protein